MCGIVAFFARRHPVPEAVLAGATQSLHHRGPDGRQHWLSADRMVGLGHARLSIIDLATGDQPIASEDGQTRIVVNGEFYGYEAVQRELEARGHRLTTGRHPGVSRGTILIRQRSGKPPLVTHAAARRPAVSRPARSPCRSR
jgi:asparagine synthetase B (glutamine-hydrolysing)